MAELEIPDGTIADKNNKSKIILDDGQEIGKDTVIFFESIDSTELRVGGFYEVRDDDANTWVSLHSDDCNDSGICGVDMLWQEVAERVKYGNAEIQN